MIEWDEIEQALCAHGPATWSASDRESYADELLEVPGGDASSVACCVDCGHRDCWSSDHMIGAA
jgi:hypothetical protein